MKNHTCLLFAVTLLLSATISAVVIRPVYAATAIYILPDGTISPPGSPVTTTNKITYTLTGNIAASIVVQRSNIVVRGQGYTIIGNGTGNGIGVHTVGNVTFENINVKNFTYGVYAEASTSIVLKNSNITENSYDGIGIFYCASTFVFENEISRNGYDGIEVYNSSNTNIQGNHISANVWFGVGLYEYSTGNVTQNRIENNYGAIELSYSSGNRIFHNDFINQTLHASTQFSSAIWDNGYPSGGNFWSNYTGNDNFHGPGQNLTGSDGIGDTPYQCDPANIDHYPLMNPWINLAIVDVASSKTVVGEGCLVTIRVTIQNQGWNAQTTNLTVYTNTTVLGSTTNLNLQKRSQAIINFTWTTLIKGNYIINSTVNRVPNEPDITDNSKALNKSLKVSFVGDVNGDSTVDIFDAIIVSGCFGSVPGGATWNGNADINSDNSIDIFDAILLSVNFGKRA